MEPAKGPDEKDDRNGDTDQPEQKTSTHGFLLFVVRANNGAFELRFREQDDARPTLSSTGLGKPLWQGVDRSGKIRTRSNSGAHRLAPGNSALA
jgi:hypothetical protein